MKLQILFSLVTLCLFLFCLIEVIQTPEGEHRHLPKLYWLGIVFFLPLVGSVAWLVAGRPQKPRSHPYDRRVAGFGQSERPGRTRGPDDDEEFLRRTRERAEEQRRRYEQEKREREQPDGDG